MNDENYNGRLVMNPGDVSFYDPHGKPIQDPNKYFKERRQADLTYTDKLKVGDVVKLKGIKEEIVVVEYVDYNDNNIIKSDYAGKTYGENNNELILFNQHDIAEIYTKESCKKL